MEPISALIAALVASPGLLASAAAALGLGGLAVALNLASLDLGDPDSVIEHMNIVAAHAERLGVDPKAIAASCLRPQSTVRDTAAAGYFDAKIGAVVYEKCANLIPVKAE